MRSLLQCLVSGVLLCAAPSEPARDGRPPEQVVSVLVDDGQPLVGAAELERLARDEPLKFLEECLLRYRRTVRGYRLTMFKQERIGDRLEPAEIMEVSFREKPFSVLLKWDKGARRAERALYVEGENNDKLLVRPTPSWYWLARGAGRLKDGHVVEDADGDNARQSGRFTLKEFGMYLGLARFLADWQAARHNGALHVEYLGEQSVENTGHRPSYVLRRTRFLRPERDGVTEQTIYIDKESWLQIGAVSNGPQGLVGAYFYRDIEINPEFAPDQFTAAGLKR
jgi:hypothetical protein